jgi:hypothetical protein
VCDPIGDWSSGSIAIEEVAADGRSRTNKREYVTVQDEGLGGMSDWKCRKLERKRPGSKFENSKIAKREGEDDTFVLKTEKGDLRYTYSTRMEVAVEEQVFKTKQGDLEDYSSVQMEMDVDEQDISIITTLYPRSPFSDRKIKAYSTISLSINAVFRQLTH